MQEQILFYSLYLLSFILLIVGVVGCILPYPGHLFVLAACAIVPSNGESYPWWLWLLLILLTLAGGLADNVTTYLGCKKKGASAAAIWASVIGLIIGAFFPPLGIILFPFIAAAGVEYFIAKKNIKNSAHVGLGAVLGLLSGMIVKLIIAGIMVAIICPWLY
ncbi:MAG: DUF456 domain-containing protein [Akkermansia sp.]